MKKNMKIKKRGGVEIKVRKEEKEEEKNASRKEQVKLDKIF